VRFIIITDILVAPKFVQISLKTIDRRTVNDTS